MTHEALRALGWTAELAESFQQHEEDLIPGRVAIEHRDSYVVATADGDVSAEISGRFRFDARGRGDYPAVGDWVALRAADGAGVNTIHAVLPRRTKISRKTAWSATEEQVVAANVDVAFVVSSLNHDLNPRRVERYLTTVWESGARPVIVLTKADLWEDVAAAVATIEAVALGVPVHPVSATTGDGVDEVRAYLRAGETGVLLGSSGVGKSTLINRFLGETRLATGEVRDDGRGRHTTSHRELLQLPGGGLVIDTPGLRELQLWDADEGLEGSFADIAALAERCRFRDCAHESEPDCAVQAAIADGSLDAERLESFRKLERELARLAARQDARAAAERSRELRKRFKQYARESRERQDRRR